MKGLLNIRVAPMVRRFLSPVAPEVDQRLREDGEGPWVRQDC